MFRWRACRVGSLLLKLFLLCVLAFGAWYLYDFLIPPLGFSGWESDRGGFILRTVLVVLGCAALFWAGIILVYLFCGQLGIRWRVLGILFSWIPPVNLILLCIIITTADREYRTERQKYRLDVSRAALRVCATKYPILLVHGVFFRDSRLFNYWGRIPAELERHGARVFYGNHNSASSIEDSAAQLGARIAGICAETGCGKVNVIAHSKGGLDVRYLLSDPEQRARVASLTTVNTPHRGCKFADDLFEKVPKARQERIARMYNAIAAKVGDEKPDFLAATWDLTARRVRELTDRLPVPEGVFCQSVGSVQRRATAGRFPLNLTHHFVHRFDGENDGLVGVDSCAFGERCTILRPTGRRGISHADVIDLNRENIPGFDVREFYVQLVSDLKKREL